MDELVHSAKFSGMVGCVIIMNTVMMAMQSDNPDWECWLGLELAFMFFFVLELSLRLTLVSALFRRRLPLAPCKP